jgi:hypothetical protein
VALSIALNGDGVALMAPKLAVPRLVVDNHRDFVLASVIVDGTDLFRKIAYLFVYALAPFEYQYRFQVHLA